MSTPTHSRDWLALIIQCSHYVTYQRSYKDVGTLCYPISHTYTPSTGTHMCGRCVKCVMCGRVCEMCNVWAVRRQCVMCGQCVIPAKIG